MFETTAAQAARPEGLPDKYWDPASGVKESELLAHMSQVSDNLNALTAERDSLIAERRAQGIGGTRDDYKLNFEGLTGPDGRPLVVDENHPLLGPAREWAFKAGIKTEAFNELAKLEVQRQIQEHQAFDELARREHARLGDHADQRKAAVAQALRARLGPDANVFMPLIELSADAVEALEALIRTTSAPPYRPTMGDRPATDTSGMTTEERIERARLAQAVYKGSGFRA